MKKLAVLFMSLSFASVNATIWRLNNNPAVDADFRTFTEAQDSASAGDTIYVEGNGNEAHYGNISITKQLVLIGPGYFLNENDSTYANPNFARFLSIYIRASAAGTEIYGLYIFTTDGNTNKLRIYASDVIISRNYFYQNNYNNLTINANVQDVTITQNYLYSVELGATVSNIMISNNFIGYRIYMNNSSSGIITNNTLGQSIENVYNSQIKNNLTLQDLGAFDALSVNNSGNYVAYNISATSLLSGGSYGPGNLGGVDMSTVLAGYPTKGLYSTDGRWQIKAGGPADGAGEGGIDCGMFGGSMPYVLSGLPAIPRIYEAIVPTAGSTISGLPVIIKAKSQN
jgi:hypothetical protein